jgi:hypothetical protein
MIKHVIGRHKVTRKQGQGIAGILWLNFAFSDTSFAALTERSFYPILGLPVNDMVQWLQFLNVNGSSCVRISAQQSKTKLSENYLCFYQPFYVSGNQSIFLGTVYLEFASTSPLYCCW